jgi:hypothetical protein
LRERACSWERWILPSLRKPVKDTMSPTEQSSLFVQLPHNIACPESNSALSLRSSEMRAEPETEG